MTETYLNYLGFIGTRALSGIANGLFYAGSAWAWPVLLLLFALTLFLTWRNLRRNWGGMKRWKRALAVIGVAASGVAVLMVGFSFRFPGCAPSEVHLWTWLCQTSMASTLFISADRFWRHLWWLALTVSPAAFLQKLFVNIFGRYGWDHVGTDDASGRTWGFRLLGRRFKVPRVASWRLRLVLALACVLIFITVTVVKHRRERVRQVDYAGLTLRQDIFSLNV